MDTSVRAPSAHTQPPPTDPMSAWGPLLSDARRIVIVHERVEDFRWFGLVEWLALALGCILMIPFWIYLVLAALTVTNGAVAVGGDGGGDDAPPGGSDPDALKVSRIKNYHHEIEVVLLGAQDATLARHRARISSETEGQSLLTTVLQLARKHRLEVDERVVPDGDSPGVSWLAHRWIGGRPLMSPEGLVSASTVEEELHRRGFDTEQTDDGWTISHAEAPMSPGIAWLIVSVVVGFVAVWIALATIVTPWLELALLVFLTPAALFLLFVFRRPFSAGLAELLFCLFGRKHYFEVTLTPNEVRYREGFGWRRKAISTEGDRLVALGFGRGLGYGREVQLRPRQLRFVGANQSWELPAELSVRGGYYVYQWIHARMVELRQNVEEHDFRTKCRYCGSLYDLAAEPACPQCGGTGLRPP